MTMKFRAHDTFYIRKGWLSKGMKNIEKKPHVFVDKEENPMDVLGIGANMVKSLRYWLPALGLTEEPKSGVRKQSFTDFGEIVYEHDKYMEETGTLYLLHYKMATNKDNVTAWYFFFNEFTDREFTKEDFVQKLQSFIKMNEKDYDVALRSLEEDFACIINTYLPNNKTEDAEIDKRRIESFLKSALETSMSYRVAAQQMSETVFVTAYRNNAPISNTVAYSIESYAYAKQNDADANLAALVKALMKYGNAAYEYDAN